MSSVQWFSVTCPGRGSWARRLVPASLASDAVRFNLPMSVTIAEVRAAALGLPEVTEQPHHEMASFRVDGKIIATVPDNEHLRIMLDEHKIRAVTSENPQSFHEFYWGKRLACLVVDLADMTMPQIRELLTEAWLRKAPPTLARQLRPEP